MGSGAFVSATVDIGDVEAGLRALEARAKNLGPAFAALKTPLRDDQREHAKTKAGPESSWAPLAASTRAHRKLARKRGSKLPRKLLGRLPTAVSYKATTSAVIGESKVKWSQVHQDGGTVGRGARLPARPFLWISDKLLGIAEDLITKALLAAWGGP